MSVPAVSTEVPIEELKVPVATPVITTAPMGLEPTAPIASEAIATPTTPVSKEGIQPYLDQVNQQVFSQEQGATSLFETDPALKTLQDTVAPGTPAPEAPNLRTLFEQLREDKGLSDLEQSVGQLEALKEDTAARLRKRRNIERGKAVASNVVAGRVTEVEQQERENLEFIDRQIAVKTSQLQAANNLITTIVNLTNTDFQNATTVYNTKFAQNLDLYKQFRAEQVGERDFQQKLKERQEDVARSNLQIYTEMIAKGQLVWNTMSSSQQAEVNKLEVTSGLGAGFVSKLRIAPSEAIKSITTRTDQSGNKWADVIKIDANGKLTTEHQLLGKEYMAPTGGGGGGGSSAERQRTSAINSAIAEVNSIKPVQTTGGWAGIFQQLVMRYASQLSLADIYNAYNRSAAGKKWGAPTENPKVMASIYAAYS